MNAFFLVGPTAVGKTAVAHCIASKSGYSVLSADSMLVYKGLNIGTAKPNAKELEEVTYYGIDLIFPDISYTVWDYRNYALDVFNSTDSKAKMIVTGGSGLYIKALTHGLAEKAGADEDLRCRLEKLHRDNGIESLQERLRIKNPEAYDSLPDKENARRLIRAIEAAQKGGENSKETTWIQQSSGASLTGLSMERDQLNSRIEKRVHIMYDSGLLIEAERLLDSDYELSRTALQAIGYSEAFACLRGEFSKNEAIERTIIRTRRFAKRQRTWFRNQTDVVWIDVEENYNVAEVAERVSDEWRKHGSTKIKT